VKRLASVAFAFACLVCLTGATWLPLFKAPPPSAFILDTVTATARVAYSTRKLRSVYAGFALNVRRSSDNTTQDIGFNGTNDLDSAAVSTFCGASDCFVAFWYDQSGNATTTIATANANQPRIYTAGSFDLLNSHVAVRFGLNSTACLSFTVSLSQPNTIAIASQHLTQVVNGHYTDGVTSNPRQLIGVSGSPATLYQLYAGTTAPTGGTLDLLSHDIVGIFSGGSSSLIIDGVTKISGTNIGTNGMGNQQLGGANGGGGVIAMNGYIGEYIVFTSVLGSPDQATIQTSWQTYWGTQ
jgi:hypothetical protein